MSRRSGWGGALAGLAAALLLACGYLVLAGVPGRDASSLDVYAFFLDHRGATRLGSALILAGLALLATFLVVVRGRLDPPRSDSSATAILACGIPAVTLAAFAIAAIGGLAVGAEDADPETSRSILDLAGAVGAAAWILFAGALAAVAVTLRRRPRRPPRILLAITVLGAIGCLLWIAPMLTDAGVLAPGSFIGTTLGLVGLVIWCAGSALWSTSAARQPTPARTQ